MNKLVSKIIKGDKLAISQAISLVENNAPEALAILKEVHARLGKSYRIGITGPPGVGKSTLVNELAIELRRRNKTVGIIAIDPTSIFSGGAILGDRIRMQYIGLDNGVFIRSMATRGYLGGTNRVTSEVADILEASGKDYIIVETVGVGQSEIEISKTADLTLVVLSPESGDSIQAMKAGIMEIADIVVVNKADRPGVDAFVTNLKSSLELGNQSAIPVLTAQAIQSVGIKELLDKIEGQLNHFKDSGQIIERRIAALRRRIRSLILDRLETRLLSRPEVAALVESSLQDICTGCDTPYNLVEKVIKRLSTPPRRSISKKK